MRTIKNSASKPFFLFLSSTSLTQSESWEVVNIEIFTRRFTVNEAELLPLEIIHEIQICLVE